MSTIKLSVDDPEFVDKIIYEVKSQGHFDVFRKECLADVDTQPAYINLHSRVEDSVKKFLTSQVWTTETNKNRLREDMRQNIVWAGYLESGVSRIVDQIIEQKMDYIQSKVEEILYQYVGIEKQSVKKEKEENGALEVETDLLPTDLEQVSPDSDKKSEEIEEEVVEDFESPAFEPIVNETIIEEKNQNSNLSAISGLTSQDSQNEKELDKDETMLSQVSSTEKISSIETPNNEEMICEEAQMAPENDDAIKQAEPIIMEAPTFDLNKDAIEFTGTERKNFSLDDSTSSNDKIPEPPVKLLPPLPQEPLSNQMEIDDNDTTDSSEIRMEIDIKDESTQESGKVEESSQDSSVKTKEKDSKDSHHHHKHHKRERSKDDHKSSSHKSSSHRHHSKSSSSRHESDKHKSRSKSSTHKSDRDKDRSSSSHKKSRHRDEHHSSSTKSRRRSTEQESANEEKIKNESEKVENEKSDKNESSPDSKKKSSILVKYDYLKVEGSNEKTSNINESEDDFLGFTNEVQPPEIDSDWIRFMQNESERNKKNSDQNASAAPKVVKTKQKSKSPDSPSTTSNSGEEIPQELKIQQQQRYETQDLYKPRFDFSNRQRGNRRGQNTDETSGETLDTNK